ncbi:hypothetical protein JXA32_17530 [Candidatus Sumerlaeota bacterium]|nr:hypothetical protein [Candidatus Sumerlaeota bacterium]
MLAGVLSTVFDGASLISKLFHLDELTAHFTGDNEEISPEQFRELIERLASNYLTVQSVQTDAAEASDGENSSAETTPTELLGDEDDLANTLEPLLFRYLDADQSGKLEGEEVAKLRDFLSYFNRELLIRQDGETPANPLETLNELVETASETTV